jgi:hypothetical protein
MISLVIVCEAVKDQKRWRPYADHIHLEIADCLVLPIREKRSKNGL